MCSILTQHARIAAAIVATAGLAGHAAAQFAEPGAVALQTFLGDEPGETYGWAVAALTDIDGDGVKEVIVPGPFGGGFAGSVDVYSGATGALLLHIPGEGILSGWSVADAGDVNADGVHDIVVGAPFGAGAVFVYSGADGSRILGPLQVEGEPFFGQAVSSAGDINGDGHADILVGAANPFTNLDGGAFVFSGADGSLLRTYPGFGASRVGGGVALTGDVDGDGFGEHILGAPGVGRAFVHSGATGELLFTLEAEPTNRAFGQFFVAGAGDVNGDCVPDFYVGDFGDDATPDDGVPPRGAAYVFSGADGSRLHLFLGEEGDGIGPGRAAGDVNGDGFDDLIVGRFTNSDAVFQGGRIDVRSGRDGAVLQTFTGTVENAQLGFDCVGMGDTNADGAIDFILSAANRDLVYIGAGEHVLCPGDLNGDGVVNPKDVKAWFISFAAGDCRADLNGDGRTDEEDLAIILGAFGKCR